jgi:hypothetical protein
MGLARETTVIALRKFPTRPTAARGVVGLQGHGCAEPVHHEAGWGRTRIVPRPIGKTGHECFRRVDPLAMDGCGGGGRATAERPVAG